MILLNCSSPPHRIKNAGLFLGRQSRVQWQHMQLVSFQLLQLANGFANFREAFAIG